MVARAASLALIVATTSLVGGCGENRALTGPVVASESQRDGTGALVVDLLEEILEVDRGNGTTAVATGGGHFIDVQVPGIDWQFAFTAVQQDPSGEADGRYHYIGSLEGLAIDFRAKVTCMMADPTTGRAWIGGVITSNESQHPLFTGAIHQVGRPTWFRVADYGEGADAPKPDRATRIFFTGSGGFTSAEVFCASGFWPILDGVERITSQLMNGNIQVKP
jgi:hypothetical protein